MGIEFVKMSAQGNDFIIINNWNLTFDSSRLSELAKKLCRRRFSVGADGLLIVEPPRSPEGAFTMRLFNPDGSEGEMCGNGARCIAWYAYVKDIATKEMIIDTLSGPVRAWVHGKSVKIALTRPTKVEVKKEVMTSRGIIPCSYVELGYPGLPHAVMEYQEVSRGEFPDLMKALKPLAREIRYNPAFPKGTNVNFYSVAGDTVYVLTYERGVEDFTLACGTGAASTVISLVEGGVLRLDNQDKVRVVVPGGELYIILEYDDREQIKNVYLEGEVRYVAEGRIYEDALL